jgi:3-deoxy-manno-octulosonate cytidylyltransferase (CMP-KDO synthetase)
MRTLAVIPCRLGATRFPGKPLVKIHGIAMVEWVYRHAKQVSSIDRLVIATDSPLIMDFAIQLGAEAYLTSSECQSGTDRVYETTQILDKQGDLFDLVLNIQGDEPALHPQVIEQVIDVASRESRFEIITAACPFSNADDIFNPNMVKVISDVDNRALYFSRSPIPYVRNDSPFAPSTINPANLNQYSCHLGIYAYRINSLRQFSMLPIDPVENLEKLEQLRALRKGMSIGVAPVPYLSLGVDTPQDVSVVEDLLIRNGLFKQP